MTQDEMNTLIGQVLEQDDRAERSTLLDQLRGEVGLPGGVELRFVP